mgnify:CR=1 FL=1
MNIKLKVAQPHENQLKDQDLKREFDEIQALVNQFEYKEDTINLAVIKGIYKHIERRMTTACVFINKIGYPIKELHGELRLRFKEKTALIAKATIDFDEMFIGNLDNDEALLVHIGLPVKGLEADEIFESNKMSVDFRNIRVAKQQDLSGGML